MAVTQKRTVRAKFKALRIAKGTQKKVAEDMGVTETTVRNLENGHSDPGVELVFGFANYFGVSVHDLWQDLEQKSAKRFTTQQNHYNA
ncbi:helix-turn-helix domain-containing protein [Saccharibacillus brassicae]|uniref:Helix-turn-helix transcriptional regulator n=1 Tax=Saccharibacillus brassicae TaxID=2583377 RepID=A0A4Y6V4D9_SACBS|nr:helix-turn-helix transcriptional regulator [Saccharibacillus brassicae]QDH23501.1 helix-turn-helix transcriptional regulator [Saccharibacillus brassicae]